MRILLSLLILFPGLLLAASPQEKPDAGRDLHRLFEEEWEWGLREYPEGAAYLGDPRYNDRLTDLSFEAIERRKARTREVLGRLAKIERTALSEEDRLSYDLFQREYELDLEGDHFPTELAPINQQGGIQQDFAILSTVTRFRGAKDYRDYLARLAAFPRKVDQTIALMKKGVETGWVPPGVPLRDVPATITAQIHQSPEKSVHWQPFEKFPEEVPETERATLREQGRKAIASDVIPAYRKLHEYATKEYLPKTRKDIGAWALREGEAFYAYFKANAAKTEHDITVEIDRYIVWPGQALAYKIGELKIKELRARAKQQLGEKFDIRKFHDAVLLSGALPLEILEKRVDAWIAREKGTLGVESSMR